MLLRIIFLFVFVSVVFSETVRYDDYVLYKIVPKNEAQLNIVKQLLNDDKSLEFWMPPTEVGKYVSVVSSPQSRKFLDELFEKHGFDARITIEDIQRAIDDQITNRKKRSTRSELYWTNYQTLDEIYDWFEHLNETYPETVSIVHAGISYEGRDITGIKISRGSAKRSFFLEGGQVGADWLSPTVLTYIADQLIRGDDTEALAASEEFDWYIFPATNPDGFEFSQNSVRLWSKNRRQVGSAVGVDLTKNWNSQWSVSGGSFTPSNINYVGIGPFSEIETRVVSQYMESIKGSLVGVLSFRAFGQRLVIPFAHTTAAEASANNFYNYLDMIKIGRRAMGSLTVKYGTQYLVGTSKDVHDGATGSLADWAKHRFNPPIVATYHLRDTGNFGYILPVDQVQPSCVETFDSVMAIIREAKYINVL